MRKTFGLLAILALAGAAHAETYDGVHQGPACSRAATWLPRP